MDSHRNASALRGTRLGRYTLVRELGAGGMAELYLARVEGLAGFSKLVAIKCIHPHKAKNERFVRMLLNEARLVATLDHPNIAHVLDVDFDQGQYFFAMEYVHGQDLRRIVKYAPSRRLQLESVLHIGIGVCAGLHHAHEARDPNGTSLDIVHRDVSPSNVIVSYEGGVKLVDFGVAKAATVVSETREGVIKGKYGYMSPEQCLGDPLDRRSDLFSVGIILWELVTGRRLYKINGELATLQRVVYADAPRPSRYVDDVSPELERIIMRALQRTPDKRYHTAQQLQLELETFAVEHKLAVSAVSMGIEMRRLFKPQIEAWREAEQAGRSLADHLAEASSEDPIESSEEADGGLDGVIAELGGGGPAADETATAAGKLAARATPQPFAAARTSAPHLIPTTPMPAATSSSSPSLPALQAQPARRRAPVIAITATVLLLGAAAAAYFLFLRSDRQPDSPERHVMPAATADVATAPVVVATAEPDAATPAAPTVPTVPTVPDPATIEAIEPDHGEPAPDAGATPSKRGHRDPHVKPKTGTGHPATKPDPDPAADPGSTAVEPPPELRIPKLTHPDAGVVSPPPPHVTTNGPPPGTVDANQVRATVRAHLGDIQECVSRARMDNRDLKGRVVMRIDLAPSGRVTKAAVASSTGATDELGACMAKAVAGWTFPAPAGGVKATISYPFAF